MSMNNPNPEMLVVNGSCRNVSICIHFFYTAALALYLMEGIHMYSMVAKVLCLRSSSL